jgi:hypothetical protein
MENLYHEVNPQVYNMVDLIVEHVNPNELNFCGSIATSTYVGCDDNHSVSIDANIFNK